MTKERWILAGKFAAVLCVVPVAILAFQSGPDPRNTGAPGDAPLACASATCHEGTPINSGTGRVQATFAGGTTYTPGVAQAITVSVSDPVNSFYGFQMTARLASNLSGGQAGNFTNGAGTLILCDNNSLKGSSGCPASFPVQFIEHSLPSRTSWTFNWTPPATNVGNVVFYVAGNAVNNNGQADRGDHVYTANFTLTPAASGPKPTISQGGIISAFDFGARAGFAAGSWLEIYGSNLSSSAREWAGGDFSGVNAPTALSGVSVSINGKPAVVRFISPGQVNVQAPADTATGPVNFTVTNGNGTSDPIILQKSALAPGMLAPGGFKTAAGRQYVVALFPTSTGVGPFVCPTGALGGINCQPAKPGDTLILFGIGFGDVTPSIAPGVIVGQSNQLTNTLNVRFDQTPATLTYRGLGPNFVGLYQFNLVVPNVADADYQLNVDVGGVTINQTAFITVKR